MESQYQPILTELGFGPIHSVEQLQVLWSGYGELVRLHVDDTSVIVKHIQLPTDDQHPRGWNTPLSHQRKWRSYQVELNWYANQANHCCARVAKKYWRRAQEDGFLLVMEDLKQAGYSQVITKPNRRHISACLGWLAKFHAQFIGDEGQDLWPNGSYWHLETRPDEWHALQDLTLKNSAHKLDRVLTDAPYQTLVHGDAKVANFCFTPDGYQAAAVDFQYVGRGCAMKDVALFISSAVSPKDCAAMERELVDEYFSLLKQALRQYQPQLCPSEVEQAWRPLFAVAWADFQRFIKGWNPGHWKINAYTERLTAVALDRIKAYP
ncbi:DUF1679 domain-containing protein [Vibrio sp. JPW-9-11-11]|uniref:phosphotransferase n=1 Tax=Vibrio sp. JPW-9-11-11 TaxID=1416532 RepID=UPI001594AFBB|nr:phosphotransferase [Vibrio sp. JPW-9-11-11]NVD08552.1 DUF1679 domain-containing protein [Vibrio sp. JPW-9-11-11]